MSIARRIVSGAGRTMGWVVHNLARLSVIVLFVGAGLFVGGFFKFSNTVTNYSSPKNIPAADGVVVLTGGSARIANALELISNKKGQRLLISGVNKDTTLKDIRRINASKTSLFDCCVDAENKALDTIGNAVESEKWAKAQGYKSLVLVTSNYHMPRSLLEFRRKMGDVKVYPYAVSASRLKQDDWWKDSGTLHLMMSEYVKYVGAWARDFVRPNVMDALQANVLGG